MELKSRCVSRLCLRSVNDCDDGVCGTRRGGIALAAVFPLDDGSIGFGMDELGSSPYDLSGEQTRGGRYKSIVLSL